MEEFPWALWFWIVWKDTERLKERKSQASLLILAFRFLALLESNGLIQTAWVFLFNF